MSCPSPLVEIALNFANDSAGQLSDDAVDTLRNLFEAYLSKIIIDSELLEKTQQCCHSKNPAERIIAILATERDEIPENPKNSADSINNSRKKTRSWSNGEDNRLMMGVHKNGIDNWNLVAQYVGNGRSRSQCSQRWIRVLDPKICKNHWTTEEEDKLMELVNQYGEKSWMRVANCLGNRSDVQCRYRYQMLKKTASTPTSNTLSSTNSSSSQQQSVTSSPSASPSPSPSPVITTVSSTSVKTISQIPQKHVVIQMKEIPMPNIDAASCNKQFSLGGKREELPLTFLVDEIVPPQFEKEEISLFFGEPINYDLSSSLEVFKSDTFFDSSACFNF